MDVTETTEGETGPFNLLTLSVYRRKLGHKIELDSKQAADSD